jgi:hypothetical protein
MANETDQVSLILHYKYFKTNLSKSKWFSHRYVKEHHRTGLCSKSRTGKAPLLVPNLVIPQSASLRPNWLSIDSGGGSPFPWPWVLPLWFSFLGEGEVLGFELWASHLLGRCSTTWATLALLALVILEIGSPFLPRPAWSAFLLFYASCHSWGGRQVPVCPAFFCWDGGFTNFYTG